MNELMDGLLKLGVWAVTALIVAAILLAVAWVAVDLEPPLY